MDREEMLTKRLLATNQKLLEALETLKPTDPDYWQRLKTLEAFHQSVIKDVELQLCDQQKDREIELELERNEIEKRKITEAERANRKGEKLEIGKMAVAAITTGVSTYAGWKMFKRATRKEEDEAILTTTDQTVVKGGLGSIFKFGNKNFLN